MQWTRMRLLVHQLSPHLLVVNLTFLPPAPFPHFEVASQSGVSRYRGKER